MSKIRIRAAAVQAAARGRPVLVFAAHQADAVDLAKLEKMVTAGTYAKHSCAHCGTHSLVTSALKTPMCVTCGTPSRAKDAAAALSSNVQLEIKAGALSGLVCVHCSTVNVLPRAVIASSVTGRHPLHCSACGKGVEANAVDETNSGDPAGLNTNQLENQQLKAQPTTADADLGRDDIFNADDTVLGESDDDELAEDDAEFADLDDVQAKRVFASLMNDDGANSVQDEQADALDGDGLTDPLADPDPVDDGDGEGFGLSDGGDFQLAAADDEDEDDEEGDDVSSSATPDLEDNGEFDTGMGLNPDGTFAMDAPAKTGQNLRELVPNDRVAAGFGDEGDEDVECDMDELPVYEGEGEDLLALASFDDTSKALSFATVGSRLIALKGHTAVAVLQPKKARKNASIMGSEVFAEAIVRVTERSGLRKALAHFHFDPIKVPSVATTRTERQIAAFQAQTAAKVQQMQKEQASCFAMAAAGLARGKFKGVENALAKGLVNEFARLGVRNAKPLTASLLQRYGMEYAKQLVLTAAKLGSMTEASRKETADMLDLVDEGDLNVSDPEFLDAATEESLDTDGDGDVDGDDFTTAELSDDLDTEEYAVAALLRPARQQAMRVQSSTADLDAAAAAREILAGRRSLFAG